MRMPRGLVDESALALLEGYAWLPGLRARSDTGVAHTRLLGQRAVGLCGVDAARFFYDEDHVQRRSAIPIPLQKTLFGRGAVHTLDGRDHRDRKAFFLSVLTTGAVEGIAESVGETWDRRAAGWRPDQELVLFDEAARAITRGVCRAVGIPLAEAEADDVARDLIAMVDGFATPGPRHWRARRARSRREAWMSDLISAVRNGRLEVTPDSALDAAARHRDADGRELATEVAAVELLNIIRPTAAVSWFVTHAAHALHRWPQHRERLAAGEEEFAESFAHEVRRFYPFAPFIGGLAVRDLTWRGEPVPQGAMVLLDLWGHDHDPELWDEPYAFRPDRFVGRDIGPFELVPQGAGDPATGHRCPGEPTAVAILAGLAGRLARMDYEVPEQDLTISLRRIPARPKSGFVFRPRGRREPDVTARTSRPATAPAEPAPRPRSESSPAPR
ncbi:cytochrome P450 [Saccharopolyspora rhizosphaerae]|uniref:Cytochrome P450 n=1 Tax=Saccharopolyspora rhizosphaerae TaxID=2492662 RepID=A0A3R8Q4U0_9PSEU|nr:cytochrome P450 [Saccharopolyspora rhizosphaerae]RRO16937.1 cytochrome P450 [Saccharopolyspora rhizosphaerae]